MIKNNSVKKLFSLAFPIALQQLLITAVGAGDSVMLGFVNGNAMAAVSLAGNIGYIESLFISAVVGGATIICAQYYGKKDTDTISNIFGLILRYVFVISILFTFVAVFFPHKLMSLFTDEYEMIEIGAEYIRMVSVTYLLTGIIQCYLCIMKTTGQVKQSVFITVFSLVLDTVLNALFIFAFHMETVGVALTSSITLVIEFFIVLLFSKKMIVKPRLFASVPLVLHKDFLHCSVPHLLNTLLFGLGTTVYVAIIGHLGTAIIAAYSVASSVRSMSVSMCGGLAQGVEIFLAEILGAGKMEEGKKIGGRLSRFSVFCGVISAILAFIFGRLMLDFMSLSDAAQSYLNTMIYISALHVFTQCYSIVVICGIFTAGGDTAFDAYSVAVTMWLGIIPLAIMAAFWWKFPPIAVYLILSLDEAVKIPWIYLHYKKYKWLNNITR